MIEQIARRRRRARDVATRVVSIETPPPLRLIPHETVERALQRLDPATFRSSQVAPLERIQIEAIELHAPRPAGGANVISFHG